MEPAAGRAGGVERVVVALFFDALAASLGFTVHPFYNGGADSALYISTARSLVEGRGYTLHYLLDFGETAGIPGFQYDRRWEGFEHCSADATDIDRDLRRQPKAAFTTDR